MLLILQGCSPGVPTTGQGVEVSASIPAFFDVVNGVKGDFLAILLEHPFLDRAVGKLLHNHVVYAASSDGCNFGCRATDHSE